MAVDRRLARIRRERAEKSRRESDKTKLITEIDGIRCERPESLRYAPPRPRDGQLWALGVPLQGFTHAGPELPSQGECDQCTRGRAGAHAGPEPSLLSGRNRRKVGGMDTHKQNARNT
eukprot:6213016-Pleurochrysis_carterae.AAC.1